MNRVVLVGCGERVITEHMPALSKFKDHFEIVLIINGTREARTTSTFCQGTNIIECPEIGLIPRILEKASPQLMIITIPPSLRLPYLEYADHKGISVICDKPIYDLYGMSFDKEQNRKFKEALGAIMNFKNADKVYSGMRRRINPYIIGKLERFKTICCRNDQGVSRFSCTINTGLWRFQNECIDNDAAHSFSLGYGTSTYTAFHVIDMISWVLETSWGTADLRWNVKVNYRISFNDLIARREYTRMAQVLEKRIPRELKPAFESEVDWGCTISVTSPDGTPLAIGQMNCIASGVTRRVRGHCLRDGYHDGDGKRMEQIDMIFHAGGIGSFHYMVDNETDYCGNNLYLSIQRNPTGLNDDEKVFEEAFVENRSPGLQQKITMNHLSHFLGIAGPLPKGTFLSEQRNTYRLYSALQDALLEETLLHC